MTRYAYLNAIRDITECPLFKELGTLGTVPNNKLGEVMRVLIVEDESTSLIVLESIFKNHAEYETAHDGEAAFEKFCNALESGNRFDLVCLDVHLPKADGVEFLNGIRAFEEQMGIVASDGTKVIIISGDRETKTVYDAMAAGCTSYLVKPLDRHKFLEELIRLGFSI